METDVQHSNNLQYHEVYISDMVVLKNIFLQKQNSKIVKEDFGLPFLLAKRNDIIVTFACLVTDNLGRIDFIIHEAGEVTAKERADFKLQVENYFKRNHSNNYREPLQLKSTINSIVNWINV